MSEEPEQDVRPMADKVDTYTADLGNYVRGQIPRSMPDDEFAAAASALMIALNRQLAYCAAAFGETHGVSADLVRKLVMGQFDRHHATAIDALRNAVTVQ